MKAACCLTVVLCMAVVASGAPDARAADLAANLRLAIAVTHPTEKPITTTISLVDPRSGAVSEVYRDHQEGQRVLVKIGGSDVLGAARAMPPADIYAFIGPSVAEPGALDSLSMLSIARPGAAVAWKRILEVPLSFSEASPYGLWNRAPLLAVSPTRDFVATTALRIGERALAGMTIRVLSMYGTEEWQLPVGRGLQVSDLAWSPGGRQLAYSLVPEGDEHTLDESLLPEAGIYIADTVTRTSAFLHHCYPAAIAWSPKDGRISIAVRPDVWGEAGVVRTIIYPGGERSDEFSVSGSAQALAYSDDGRSMAVQVSAKGAQTVQVRASPDGWGRDVFRLPESGGRLALLGWVRLAKVASGPVTGTSDERRR